MLTNTHKGIIYSWSELERDNALPNTIVCIGNNNVNAVVTGQTLLYNRYPVCRHNGTDTWAMQADNLHIVCMERMARWICEVSLKDRKRSVDLYSLSDTQSVADVARRGRLRWFGHLERKSADEWAHIALLIFSGMSDWL